MVRSWTASNKEDGKKLDGIKRDVILSSGEAGARDRTTACITCAPSGTDPSPLNLQSLHKAIDDFESAGKKLNASLTRKLSTGPLDPQLAATLNHGMMQVERNWLNPDGIPGRPWFKHILYGARYTYAHLELPGLTEAVEKQDWVTAKKQAEILERSIHNNTKLLLELNQDLQP
jgi:hypothetical protein